MKQWTYYGGPVDGGVVDKTLISQDYMLMSIADGKGHVVTYYYVKNVDGDNTFDYCGEVEDEDEE